MTSAPTWLTILVPVLAAAVAGGIALLGILIKNRSDARAGVRERREPARVYLARLATPAVSRRARPSSGAG